MLMEMSAGWDEEMDVDGCDEQKGPGRGLSVQSEAHSVVPSCFSCHMHAKTNRRLYLDPFPQQTLSLATTTHFITAQQSLVHSTTSTRPPS